MKVKIYSTLGNTVLFHTYPKLFVKVNCFKVTNGANVQIIPSFILCSTNLMDKYMDVR